MTRPASFEAADLNNDGVIDREEYAAAAALSQQRRPQQRSPPAASNVTLQISKPRTGDLTGSLAAEVDAMVAPVVRSPTPISPREQHPIEAAVQSSIDRSTKEREETGWRDQIEALRKERDEARECVDPESH